MSLTEKDLTPHTTEKRFSIEEMHDNLRKELIIIETEIRERNERLKQLRSLLKAADKAKNPKQ